MDDDPENTLKIFGLVFIFFIVIILVIFLTSSHTGNIAGYSITMPGIAWNDWSTCFFSNSLNFICKE